MACPRAIECLLALAVVIAPCGAQTNAQMQNAAGQQLIQQKCYDEARRAFAQAIALQPNDSDALENLALLDLMMRSEAEAQSVARKLITLDPLNYNAHLTLAITLLYQAKPAESVHHFEKLHAASDRDPLILAGLIECYSHLNRHADADRVRRILDGVKIDPRDALLSVQLFQRAPLHHYVLAWLEQANRESPTFYPLYPALGAELFASGDIAAASRCLQQALAIRPEDAMVLLALYRTETKAGHQSEALKYLYAARTAVESNFAAALGYAEILVQNRMFLDARVVVETALRAHPQNVRLHYLRGVSLLGLSDLPGARHEFEQALKIEPDSVENWIARGVVDLSQGAPESALPDFCRAAALDGNSAAAYFYIGQCLRRVSRPDTAIQSLRHAIRLAPNDGRSYAELGAILLSQGKSPEAEQALRRAVSLDSSIASAHYQLGLLLRKKGDPAASSAELRLAKDLREKEAKYAVVKLVASPNQ